MNEYKCANSTTTSLNLLQYRYILLLLQSLRPHGSNKPLFTTNLIQCDLIYEKLQILLTKMQKARNAVAGKCTRLLSRVVNTATASLVWETKTKWRGFAQDIHWYIPLKVPGGYKTTANGGSNHKICDAHNIIQSTTHMSNKQTRMRHSTTEAAAIFPNHPGWGLQVITENFTHSPQ